MRNSLFAPFYSVPVILLLSCSDTKREPAKEAVKVKPPVTQPVRTTAGGGLYQSYYLAGASSLAQLSHTLGTAKMQLVYDINRRDLKHLKLGDTIAIPSAGDSAMIYSPFPLTLSGLDSAKKCLLVSRRVQAFGAYEMGKLVRWGPTSTGKKATPTPERLYYMTWKSKETHSTVDDSWILKWFFNLDNLDGISLHEYDLPGYPVSHSCVRLLAEDAEWIYHWGDQWKLSTDGKTVDTNGTPVIVFGEYAYGKTPPWKKLVGDAHATDLSTDELTAAVDKYLPRTAAPPLAKVDSTAQASIRKH
jgi:hypothetical protein